MRFPPLFDQSVARTPDRVAVVDLAAGETVSYRDLHGRAASVARALRERGVDPGDRVALCLTNRIEHVVAFLATQFLGAVATPFNFRSSSEDVRYHLDDADPVLFVFGEAVRDAVERGDDPPVESIYVGDDPPPYAGSFASLVDSGAGGDEGTTPDLDRPEADPAYDDPSVMLYSSGTTGDPKGIPLTHEATASRVLSASLGQRYYLEETMLGVMPLYHTVGLHAICLSLLAMSGTYLAVRRFDPETCVRAIDDWGVTALHEAPTVFSRMLDAEAMADADVSSVRAVGFSGAPMTRSTFERTLDAFDPDLIANLYGTTEALGTLGHVDLHDLRDPTVAGPAHVFQRTRIVDPRSADPSAEVPRGEEGELIVHTASPVTFDGYWNKPERTEEAIHDGWFFTGDVAEEVDGGNVRITGRVGDMIISGGENIHPVEVEDVLAAHGSVADVGVVGLPDEEWGEVVTAYVVPAGDVTGEDLDRWCLADDSLADFKRPRRYEFVEDLPRNPSGKVVRYRLRERVESEE